MTKLPTKTAFTAIAAVSLLGTLAGCASASADDSTSGGSTASSGSGSTASYKDGDYEESATYQSPEGTETIDVKLTLAKNVITAVTVTGTPSGPDAVHYQGEFENGIASVVVGKNIDEISVHKVAGSSLTSGGFNSAISAIKDDAKA